MEIFVVMESFYIWLSRMVTTSYLWLIEDLKLVVLMREWILINNWNILII